jgi:hypothetical protein
MREHVINTQEERYLHAVRIEHLVVIALITSCLLGPLARVVRTTWHVGNVVAVLPLLVFMLASLGVTWWSWRRFGADYLGGGAINTLLPIAAIMTLGSGLIVGSGMLFFPQGAPWLAIPGMPLMLGMILFHDLGLRGVVHAWMRRVGFGRTMRIVVPVGLSLLLTCSADREGTFVLPAAFAVATLANGFMREHIEGMMYLLVTPPILLFASWLITG